MYLDLELKSTKINKVFIYDYIDYNIVPCCIHLDGLVIMILQN